jgi:hypothetical protein
MKKITIILIAGIIVSIGCKESTIENSGDSVSFKLDFSKQKTLKYAYNQEMVQTGSMGESMGVSNVLIKANSSAEWVIIDSSTARLSILNMNTIMLQRDASNKVIDSRRLQMGDLTISDINYYGRVKDVPQQTLLIGFFALPDHPIKIGGSDTINVIMGSNGNGITTYIPGFAIVKYVKNEEKFGRNCAVLSVESKIVMEKVINNQSIEMIGSGTCYFDLEDKIIVYGQSKTTLFQLQKTPSIPRDLFGDDMPENLTMNMETSIYFELLED